MKLELGLGDLLLQPWHLQTCQAHTRHSGNTMTTHTQRVLNKYHRATSETSTWEHSANNQPPHDYSCPQL